MIIEQSWIVKADDAILLKACLNLLKHKRGLLKQEIVDGVKQYKINCDDLSRYPFSVWITEEGKLSVRGEEMRLMTEEKSDAQHVLEWMEQMYLATEVAEMYGVDMELDKNGDILLNLEVA